MTDLFDPANREPRPDGGYLSDDEVADLRDELGIGAPETPGATPQCQWVDEDGTRCELRFPEKYNPMRKYCDGHQRGGYLHKRRRSESAPKVTVNIKTPTAPKTKATDTKTKVAGAANAWLMMASVLLETTGDAECSRAIATAAPQVAAQLAELSVYHPGIAKVLAPVEASGEVLVWISLVIAVSPIILTVLVHHELISPTMAERFAVVTALGAVVGQAPADAAAE